MEEKNETIETNNTKKDNLTNEKLKIKKIEHELKNIKTKTISSEKIKKISFETASKELDVILSKLEKGNLNLEETVNLYEQGANLLKVCSDAFNVASGKITIIKDEIEKMFINENDL